MARGSAARAAVRGGVVILLVVIGALVPVLGVTRQARAASVAACSWTGLGGKADSDWSDPANWNGSSGCTGSLGVPGSSDLLLFPGGVSHVDANDDISGLTGLSLAFAGSGHYVVTASAGVTIGLAGGGGVNNTGAIVDQSKYGATIDAPIDVAPSAQPGPTIDLLSSGTLTFGGTISSSSTPTSPVTFEGGGTGTIDLTMPNSYGAGTVVANGGNVQLAASGALGTGSVTVQAGGQLALNQTPSDATTTQSNSLVLGDGNAGTAALEDVSGQNSWTGGIVLDQGTTDELTASSPSAGLTVSSGIGGAGELVIAQGSWQIQGYLNNYTGGTLLAAGASVSVNDGLGTGPITVQDGASLNVGGNMGDVALPNALTLGSGQGGIAEVGAFEPRESDAYLQGNITLTAGSTGELVDAGVAGSISGPGTLLLVGYPDNRFGVTLDQADSYTGSTEIDGSVGITNAGGLGSGPVVIDSGPNDLSSGGLTVFSPSDDGQYMTVPNDITLGSGSGYSQLMNEQANVTFTGTITLATGSTGVLSPSDGSFSVTGPVGGDGGLFIEGGQVVDLLGSNSYSGSTTIYSSTVAIDASGGFGTGPVTVEGTGGQIQVGDDGAPFSIPNALNLTGSSSDTDVLQTNGPITWAGPISTSVATQIVGIQPLTLSGDISGSGTVAIGGTVIVPSGSTASIPLTVLSGATLDGTGSVGLVNCQGTIYGGTGPGADGVLTVAGLTMTSGCSLQADIDGTTPGTGYSQIDSTGPVQVGGTLDVQASIPATPDNAFDLIVNSSGVPVSGTFDNAPDGASFLSGGETFDASYQGGTDGSDVVITALAEPPTITALDPDGGPPAGGNIVTVSGTNFTAGTTVSFGGQAATDVVVQSPASLEATAPAGSGTVDVTASNGSGTSSTSVADLYSYAPPTITSVTPDSGPLSTLTRITVEGSGFVPGADLTATADGRGLPVYYIAVVSSTEIMATLGSIPNPGSLALTVTTPAGQSAQNAGDLFAVGAPEVTAVQPNVPPSPGGTATITGGGFSPGDQVSFGSVPATSVQVVDGGSLIVGVPASSGDVDVTVSNAQGTSSTSASDLYSYEVPTVTGLSVSQGPPDGGYMIEVTGTGFSDGDQVSFGPTPGTVSGIVSSTELDVVVPSGAQMVNVTVSNPVGRSHASPADHFTYGAPIVTAVSPQTGPSAGGTNVTITGFGFTPKSKVDFGSASAASVTVNSPTSITATSPSGTGTVDITVHSPAGTSTTSVADQFTFVTPSPTITGFRPASGPVGTTVTIVGTNLKWVLAVAVDGVPATVLKDTTTTVEITVPIGAATGTLTVTTPGGTANTAKAFKVT